MKRGEKEGGAHSPIPGTAGDGGLLVARWHRVNEGLKILLITLVSSLTVKVFVIDAVRVPSPSMEETLLPGDFLLVNKILYGPSTPRVFPFTHASIPWFRLPAFASPRPGDVVVFRFPGEMPNGEGQGGTLFVKRVVGLPGQSVGVREGAVIVDGTVLRAFPSPPAGRPTPDYGPVVVPPGHYFVLGDNLADSYDSRAWGFLPADHLVGKAFLIYWSAARNGIQWRRIGTIIR